MRPPSTRNVVPLTYDDSSLARKSAPLTISRGLREPPHRPVHAPALERGRVVAEDVQQQRRLDRPGAERVDAHALPGELHRELAAHRQHGALRRRVGDLRGRRAEERDERRDVDHRAAAALEQVRDAVLAAEEDALGVDGLHAVPGVDRGVEDRGVVGGRDARVVVEDVDAAEALRRRVHHRLDAARRPRRRPRRRTRAVRARSPSPPRPRVDVGDADARAFLARRGSPPRGPSRRPRR